MNTPFILKHKKNTTPSFYSTSSFDQVCFKTKHHFGCTTWIRLVFQSSIPTAQPQRLPVLLQGLLRPLLPSFVIMPHPHRTLWMPARSLIHGIMTRLFINHPVYVPNTSLDSPQASAQWHEFPTS